MSPKISTPTSIKATLAQERLRKRYRPPHVRLLFVGESPPASGRFFYQANSGLYRAIREGFVTAFPSLDAIDFLKSFRALGCYLVDLCGMPVDHLDREDRRQACQQGEARLSRIISELQPDVMITVVRSIADNVTRAQRHANWLGPHFELPYPGRWHDHRVAFLQALAPVLRQYLKTGSDAEPSPSKPLFSKNRRVA